MLNLFGEEVKEPEIEKPSAGLYTGRYTAIRRYAGAYLVSISVGTPDWANVDEAIEMLKPYGLMGAELSDEQFDEQYIKRLESYGVEKINRRLAMLPKDRAVILCCHEDILKAACHRRTFAKWWKRKTGQVISEYGISECDNDQAD